MIGSSHSIVSDEIGLKSSVMNVEKWVISSMNAQRNRKADLILMVQLVHSRVLLFCHKHHLILLIGCQKADYSRGLPLVVQCQYGLLGI